MKRRGFTLIELLIVVAIIAILAAIAVPNFLEAQVRSKISRCRADERSAATALEAYCVDYNQFPDTPLNDYTCLYVQYATQLSTPVAYSTTADFKDPFSDLLVAGSWNTPARADYHQTLNCFCGTGWWAVTAAAPFYAVPNFYPKRGFTLFSNGPSRIFSNGEHLPYCYGTKTGFRAWTGLGGGLDVWCDGVYDATNGTKSYGSISRFGGELSIPQSM